MKLILIWYNNMIYKLDLHIFWTFQVCPSGQAQSDSSTYIPHEQHDWKYQTQLANLAVRLPITI